MKLARLARLPRMYRLIRVLRMLKMFRVLRKTALLKDLMSQLNISQSMTRMLQLLGSQVFLVHLMACFWFLFASFEENLYDTWVGARQLVDAESEIQYLNSFYWAFQTVTTVGYGDFSISTTTEYIVAIFWMIVGVSIYTITIGSVTNII